MIRLVIVAITLWFLLSVILLVRRNLLFLSYTLFWLFVVFAVFSLGFFPSLNINLSRILGIDYPPILPVVVAIMVIFIKLLKQDIELSKRERRQRRLIQEIALLKVEKCKK